MKREQGQFKSGDLVLVQPMRYCYTFTSGGIKSLDSSSLEAEAYGISHHWTGDGFTARILSSVTLETPHNTEEYLEIKIFGKGRKHFVMRNGEKTKVIWIQQRLVTRKR